MCEAIWAQIHCTQVENHKRNHKNKCYIESIFFLVSFLSPKKQLEHWIVMFWPNKTQIGIYFLFHYLRLDNNKVNYLVIMVDGEALSQSVFKWKLDGTNTN